MDTGSSPNGFTAGLPNCYFDHRTCFFYGLEIHLCKSSFLSSARLINFGPKPPLPSSHFSGLCEDLNKAEKPHAACVEGWSTPRVNCLPTLGEGSTGESNSAGEPFAEPEPNGMALLSRRASWGSPKPLLKCGLFWDETQSPMNNTHDQLFSSRKSCRWKWSWHEAGRASGYTSLLN